MNLGLRILTLLFIITKTHSLPYDVYRLDGPTVIDRDVSPNKQTIDIYCYSGTSKNLLALWQTVKFNIKIGNEEFSQYLGDDPEQVYKAYTEDSYGWASVSPFQRKAYRTVSLGLFTTTCMALNTKHRHTIELQVQRVDLWRVVVMLSGVALILASRMLSGSPVLFYACGVLVGVCASFMVLVYYVSRLLPRKTLTYGILIGGWTVGVYLFQQLWENLRTLAVSYQAYVFWYTLVAGFVSFVVCYRIGPPKNERSKNLVMWSLQLVGVFATFFSSQYQEASAAAVLLALATKHFPRSWLLALQGHWRRRFPPRPRLLSDEEYYEQGARETRAALEQLRRHCASPDCAQWRLMLRLHDAKRFASFVQGDSHLSDDEILDYESYAFSLERAKPAASSPLGPASRRASTPASLGLGLGLDISDDDSDESDEL